MRGHAVKTDRSERDTLLIDFDGTICATARAVRFSLETVFSEISVGSPDPKRVETSIGSGHTLRETFLSLHPNSGISDDEIVRLEYRYREVYSSAGYQYEALFSGAEATLEECARNARIIILSNKGLGAIEAALGRFGLRQHVSAVVAESPGMPRKPDARLFDAVRRRIGGVRRERSLVVGDTEADLRFARNAGLRSCWALYGYGHHARCMAVGHDYVLDQLEGLPGILRDWSARRSSGSEYPK